MSGRRVQRGRRVRDVTPPSSARREFSRHHEQLSHHVLNSLAAGPRYQTEAPGGDPGGFFIRAVLIPTPRKLRNKSHQPRRLNLIGTVYQTGTGTSRCLAGWNCHR